MREPIAYETRYTKEGKEVKTPIYCERCGDKGYTGGCSIDRLEMWEAWDCDCQARAQGREEIAGFPRYLKQQTMMTFDWMQHEKQKRAIYEYVKSLSDNIEQGRGLMLIGGVGTGKTHISVAIGKLYCAQPDWHTGVSVHFVNVPAILSLVRSGFGKAGSVEDLVLDRLHLTDLVILDDIAAEKTTDWAADFLYRIINDRYERMSATIITANVTLEALKQRVGERVVSRLYERSLVVDMSGPDYRTKLHSLRKENSNDTASFR